MYQLTLHIEYLLLRHDCVVVPGFGAFINVRHAARYDASRGIWMPPVREVRFNSALSHDDGLLANSFARKNQVSFQEGREILRHSIAQLREALDCDGEVTLGQLGILQQKDGTVSFLPATTPNRLVEILGYLPAGIKAKNTDKDKEELQKEEALQKKEEVVPQRRFDTDKNYYIPVNKVFAHTAACLLVVLVAALSIILPASNRQQIDKASVVPVDKIIEAKVAEQETPLSAATAPVATRADEVAVTSAPTVVEETKNPVEGRYHLVVATYNTRAEAEKFMATHKGCGYDLQVVTTKTKSRVSAKNSDNREELQRLISSPEFHSQFRDAWIWEK